MEYISKIKGEIYTVSKIGSEETKEFTQNDLTNYVKCGNIVLGTNIRKNLFYSLIPITDKAKKRSDFVYGGEQVKESVERTALVTIENVLISEDKNYCVYSGTAAIYNKKSCRVDKFKEVKIFVPHNPVEAVIKIHTKQGEILEVSAEHTHIFAYRDKMIDIPLKCAVSNLKILDTLRYSEDLVRKFLYIGYDKKVQAEDIFATSENLREVVNNFKNDKKTVACWLNFNNEKYLLYKGTRKKSLFNWVSTGTRYRDLIKPDYSELAEVLTEFYNRDSNGTFKVGLGDFTSEDYKDLLFGFRTFSRRGVTLHCLQCYGFYHSATLPKVREQFGEEYCSAPFWYKGIRCREEDVKLEGIDGVIEYSSFAEEDWNEQVLEITTAKKAKSQLLGISYFNVKDNGDLISFEQGREKHPQIIIPESVKKIRKDAINLPPTCTFEVKGDVRCLKGGIHCPTREKNSYSWSGKHTYIFDNLSFNSAVEIFYELEFFTTTDKVILRGNIAPMVAVALRFSHRFPINFGKNSVMFNSEYITDRIDLNVVKDVVKYAKKEHKLIRSDSLYSLFMLLHWYEERYNTSLLDILPLGIKVDYLKYLHPKEGD